MQLRIASSIVTQSTERPRIFRLDDIRSILGVVDVPVSESVAHTSSVTRDSERLNSSAQVPKQFFVVPLCIQRIEARCRECKRTSLSVTTRAQSKQVPTLHVCKREGVGALASFTAEDRGLPIAESPGNGCKDIDLRGKKPRFCGIMWVSRDHTGIPGS